jgi:hypothetical protein
MAFDPVNDGILGGEAQQMAVVLHRKHDIIVAEVVDLRAAFQ